MISKGCGNRLATEAGRVETQKQSSSEGATRSILNSLAELVDEGGVDSSSTRRGVERACIVEGGSEPLCCSCSVVKKEGASVGAWMMKSSGGLE